MVAKNISNLLRLFQNQLKHDDPYVHFCVLPLKLTHSIFRALYLAGIAGLSALGDVYPDQVIPITIERFSNRELSLALRLNLSEALLRIAQRTGEMLPKYGLSFCGLHNSLTHSSPQQRTTSLVHF